MLTSGGEDSCNDIMARWLWDDHFAIVCPLWSNPDVRKLSRMVLHIGSRPGEQNSPLLSSLAVRLYTVPPRLL